MEEESFLAIRNRVDRDCDSFLTAHNDRLLPLFYVRDWQRTKLGLLFLNNNRTLIVPAVTPRRAYMAEGI
jgi:hypothetical protein